MPLQLRALLFVGFLNSAFLGEGWSATAWVSVCCNNPGLVSRYDTATHKSLPLLNSSAPAPVSAIFSPNGSTIYVADEGNTPEYGAPSVVTVLDAASGQLLQSIPIPEVPFDVAISADGGSLYVASANFDAGGKIYVHRVDTGSGEILATSTGYLDTADTVGLPVARLAISADASKVYVALLSGVVALNPTTLVQTESTKSVTLPLLSFAVSPDGSHIYIPQQTGATASIAALNTGTFQIDSTVSLGSGYSGPLALNPAGTVIYAATSSSRQQNPPGTLSAVDIQSKTVAITYPLARVPIDLAISTDASTLFGNVPAVSSAIFGSSGGGLLQGIDTNTGAVTNLAPLPGPTLFLHLSPAAPVLLAGNFSTGELEGIDLTSGSKVQDIPLGENGGDVSVGPNETVALAVNIDDISVVNVATGTYLGTIYLPGVSSAIISPTGIAYAIAGNFQSSQSELFTIDLKSLTVHPILALSVAPSSVMVSSTNGQTLYIATYTEILEVDTATATITGQISIGANALAVNPKQSGVLYLLSVLSGTALPQLITWNLQSGSAVQTVDLFLGEPPSSFLISQGDGLVYVVTGSIYCVDVKSGFIKWFNGPNAQEIEGMALTPDGSSIVVTGEFVSSVFVFDAITGIAGATYPLSSPGSFVRITK